MDSWVAQPGFPEVKVQKDEDRQFTGNPIALLFESARDR
jgi:aminopeptidase N